MSGHPVEVILSLEDLGLVHAPGSSCDLEKCKADGGHRAEVLVDLGSNELITLDDCIDLVDEPVEDDMAAMQAVHEQMHPRGTVYIEFCREPVCRDLRGAI